MFDKCIHTFTSMFQLKFQSYFVLLTKVRKKYFSILFSDSISERAEVTLDEKIETSIYIKAYSVFV